MISENVYIWQLKTEFINLLFVWSEVRGHIFLKGWVGVTVTADRCPQ